GMALVFGSGFCALVYQIAWTREFRLVFGASTSASAAVLAAFTFGLGAGSWFLSRRADASQNPLRLYAVLEGGIALTAATSLLLSRGVRALYMVLGGTVTLGTVGGNALRIVLTCVVIGAPTFLMGGTLPALVRAFRDASDAHRGRVAWFY